MVRITTTSILVLAWLLVWGCGGGEPKTESSTTVPPPDTSGGESGRVLGPLEWEPGPGIIGEEVTYAQGGVTFKGYLALRKGQEGPRPGVLVVHEWWGHDGYTRKRAEMFAELGYAALAVDMYGEGKRAAHPKDAGKFASEVMSNMDVAVQRFVAAKDLLLAREEVDGERTAAVGYCFGGAVVLEVARAGVDLDVVATFHGMLGTETPAREGEVKAKILVYHGAEDPLVPSGQVEAFKKEMDAAGVDYDFVAYEGAVHAFTNPAATERGQKFGIPIAYHEEADRASWEAATKAFQAILHPDPGGGAED